MNKLFSSGVFAAALAAAMLFGCSSSDTTTVPFLPPPDTSGLLASGGTGSTGSGGNGGMLWIDSSRAVTISKSGSVDAGFIVAAPAPSFGATHVVISSGTTTTVQVGLDDISGGLYAKGSETRLYLGNGDGDTMNDQEVTGLTVQAGATLVLSDQGYWPGTSIANMTGDVVVDGTLAAAPGTGMYLEGSLIAVGAGGTLTTSATTTDSPGMDMYLGNGPGVVKKIINRGTIEAKGKGSGNGGYMYMTADDLVANYGTIDISGGSSESGSGGSSYQWYSLEIYVERGNFYSSGTVRMNGGNGHAGTGGNAGQAWIQTTFSGNDGGMNGDIILSGAWEAMGGNGEDGDGGGGGYLGFQTSTMGTIAVNATMTIKGGSGKGAAASGGSPEGIEFYSQNYYDDVATPGKIRVSGRFDLRGGDGDMNGGSAGYFDLASYGSNLAGDGVDVEVVGFPFLYMSGGSGAGSGGVGGLAEIYAATTINNSSSIVLSGGAGDSGGSTYGPDSGWYSVYFEADHVTTTGKITANGGKGDTVGGDGGYIEIYSNGGTATTAAFSDMSVSGGTGPTPGADGYITIDGGAIPE